MGIGEFLRCYCGDEVACYHTECLGLVDPEYAELHDLLYNTPEAEARVALRLRRQAGRSNNLGLDLRSGPEDADHIDPPG